MYIPVSFPSWLAASRARPPLDGFINVAGDFVSNRTSSSTLPAGSVIYTVALRWVCLLKTPVKMPGS